jgi:hypothetical protein
MSASACQHAGSPPEERRRKRRWAARLPDQELHVHAGPSIHACLRAGALAIAALLALRIDPSGAQGDGITLTWTTPRDASLPAGWSPLTFDKIPRHTRYSVAEVDGSPVLKAQSERAASGLINALKADARALPLLRWRWKVENTLRKGDVTRKAGDDYPARIYVAFAYDPTRASLAQRIKYEAARLIYGAYPPHAGLNYIWDTRAPVDTMVPNPFTDRVRMIVVESGDASVGMWRAYERDIYKDYKRAFGEEPPMISGIAVMTDTDNTGEAATAYYGDITLSPPSR